MAIEEQCDIAIPDSDLPASADGITVDQLARLVDRKLSRR